MTSDSPIRSAPQRGLPVVPVDVLAIMFRHLLPVAFTFSLLFLAVFAYVLFKRPAYDAHMTILVKRERVDPIVAAEDAPLQQWGQGVTEQELNSEVELLRGQDLIEKVILATGLHERRVPSLWSRLRERVTPGGPQGAGARKLAAAVVDFEDRLTVEPLKKTTLIRVSYRTEDGALGAQVLSKLADLYLEKHLAVHRPFGALDFFDEETDRYRKTLATARARAAQYARKERVVSVALEKELSVRQGGALETALQETQVQIEQVRQRMRALQDQLAATPERIVTERRDAQARLMETQQATLLQLQLKRIELQHLFQPNYPPLVEVEQQIAKAEASIEAAKASPIVEAVTNRDPTHDYLAIELAKARTEHSALQGKYAATQQMLARQRREARRLDEVEIRQADIERDVKLADQNYMAYVKKREEARISNALDLRRIVNVAVAETPTVPPLPAGLRRSIVLLAGLVLAAAASVGLALVLDYFDASFRTPEEVQAFLGTPVLAALPRQIR